MKANNNNTQHLSDLLLQLRRKLNERTKEHTLKYELTGSQLEVLWFIGSHGKTSMDGIANYLNVKPPSVTAMIDKMEREGYVKRTQSTRDRRIMNVTLSPKIQKEFAYVKAQKEATFNELMDRLSDTDKQELERILTILISA